MHLQVIHHQSSCASVPAERKMREVRRLLWMVLFALYIAGCSSPSSTELWNYQFNTLTKMQMQHAYYWQESLPSTIEVTYVNPGDFLESLLHERDKEKGFTYFMRTSTYNQAISGAASNQHGMEFQERNGGVYVAIVYPETEASGGGIERGYRFVEIGGNPAPDSLSGVVEKLAQNSRNTILFEKPDGTKAEVSNLEKSDVKIPFVLPVEGSKGKVFTVSDKKVGYMHYLSFMSSSEEELLEAIKYFADYDNGNGIDEFILDLRYNLGGSVNVALTLMSALVKKNHLGEPAVYSRYNSTETGDKLAVSRFFTKEELTEKGVENLGLERLFVLTTGNSASASEMLITALDAYMDVHLIGTRTYGKFVGQSLFTTHQNYGYLFFLVTFSFFNQDAFEEKDFSDDRLQFDGIVPDYIVSEFKEEAVGGETLEILKPIGSDEDPLVKAALYFIENDGYPPASTSSTSFVSTTDFGSVLMSENPHSGFSQAAGLLLFSEIPQEFMALP